MTSTECWSLIEVARGGASDPVNGDQVAEQLVEVLAALDAGTIVAFGRAFDEIMASAYRWDLWGAAYLIGGGRSDDGFEYFLGWLVAQGRDVFDRALESPDSLADLLVDGDGDDTESEQIWYAAPRAHERVTEGERLPRDSVPWPTLEPDWDFDDDDEMRARFPRLSDLFLSS